MARVGPQSGSGAHNQSAALELECKAALSGPQGWNLMATALIAVNPKLQQLLLLLSSPNFQPLEEPHRPSDAAPCSGSGHGALAGMIINTSMVCHTSKFLEP